MAAPPDSEELQRLLAAMRRGTAPELQSAFEEALRNQERIMRGLGAPVSRTQLETARAVAQHADTHFEGIRSALSVTHPVPFFGEEQDLLYKHLFEDLTSALDYIAIDLVERWGTPEPNRGALRRVSFPYRSPGQSDAEFDGTVDRLLPGVRSTRPDLVTRLGDIAAQEYLSKPWLWVMSEIVNQLKHRGFPRRSPGLMYGRAGIRTVGNSNVAVQPTSLFDSVPDPAGGVGPFNLSDFAEQTIAFVKGIVAEFSESTEDRSPRGTSVVGPTRRDAV